MAKGPQNSKTGSRASVGQSSRASSAKSSTARKSAAKTSAAKSAAAKTSAPKSTAKSTAKTARADNASVSKAALRAAFEKAMQGRGLDEADDAFDDALADLYGESAFDPASEDVLESAAKSNAEALQNAFQGAGGMPQGGEMGNLLDFYSQMLNSNGGTGDDLLGDMTQGFSMVLGSGPAFAALESMLSNVSAQGAVLMNAVQTQRQLDQIGLCCTSECVKQLMSLNTGVERD